MAVKTITNATPKKKAKSFPKIMKSNMYIVLFHSKGNGTILDVLSDDAGWAIGDTRSSIPTSCYTDYNGPVTIQNK